MPTVNQIERQPESTSNALTDYNHVDWIASVIAGGVYTDIHNSFLHPIKNDIMIARDLDAIFNSLKNIILTPRGSRAFFPEFGTAVGGLLFENADWATAYRIEKEIADAIGKFEPRMQEYQVKVTYDDNLPNSFAVTITFVPRWGGVATTEFTLNRIR